MKSAALWQISVSTSRTTDDTVGAVLERVFGTSPAVYSPAATEKSIVSVFSSTPLHPHRRKELVRRLARLKQNGISTGRISIRRLARQDWAESWKRHFKPIAIGSRLLIKPSWSKRRPAKNQAVIVLDPGLSFGTGHHPTTTFCLRQLAAWRQPAKTQSLLDIGTGSGILAIAAAQLGCAPVDAIDSDPQAIRMARMNARRNHVDDRITFQQQDIARFASVSRQRYDVICANLTSDLLMRYSRPISRRLLLGGTLILAGILQQEFAAVEQHYVRAGLRLMVSQAGNEWRSGAFARREACERHLRAGI
jgi:ribosomal protein L11 methyltransferase